MYVELHPKYTGLAGEGMQTQKRWGSFREKGDEWYKLAATAPATNNGHLLALISYGYNSKNIFL